MPKLLIAFCACLIVVCLMKSACWGQAAPMATRHALPLRLALCGFNDGKGFVSEPGMAQSLFTHRLPNATVDSFWPMVGGGDEFFRYTDIHVYEHKASDQVRALNLGQREYGKQFEHLADYDVVAFQGLPVVAPQKDENSWWGSQEVDKEATNRLHQALLDFLNRGGTIVITGNLPKPDADSPLAPVFNWTPAEDVPAVPHPAFAGMPVEVFSAYGKVKVAAPAGGQVINRLIPEGKPVPPFAAVWPVGKGRVVHIGLPVATAHTGTPFAFLGPDRDIDDDDISMRLMEQIFYYFTYQQRAYPALIDLPMIYNGPVAAGETITMPAMLYAKPGLPVALKMQVMAPGPGGAVLWQGSKNVTAETETTTVSLSIPIGVNWGTGTHTLRVQVTDPAGKALYHEALLPIPVVPKIDLTLKSDKPGYAVGAPVTLEASLTSRLEQPLTGRLRIGIFDFRGRALYAAGKPVTLAAGAPATVTFDWKLPRTDLPAYTFWAKVELVSGNQVWGSATTKFYRFERWSTRNQPVWGLSSYGQLEDGPGIPAFHRLLMASGFNSINWTPPINYMERFGWFSDTQDMMYVNTFSPQWWEGDETAIAERFKKDMANYFKYKMSIGIDPRSPEIAIRSVGEEGGYGPGWGTVWEWKEDVAPEQPNKRFQQYLRTMYPTLDDLNKEWETTFTSWDEVKLEKKYIAAPENMSDRNKPPLALRNHARYTDTRNFFDWYYQWWVDIAVKTVREFSPVPLYVYSTGNYFNVKVEVKSEPSLFEPRPIEPGYNLPWLQSPDPDHLEGLIWAYCTARIGHMAAYCPNWISNYDMTLSNAALANLRFKAKASRVQTALLRFDPALSKQLIVYSTPNKRLHGTVDLAAALMQAGLPQATPYAGDLQQAKVLLAQNALRMSEKTAAQIRQFVADGGTLICTRWFAVEDEHGKLFAASPGLGLEEVVGVRQSENHSFDARVMTTNEASAPLPPGLVFVGQWLDDKPELLAGTKTLVSYKTGQPAVTAHDYGKGKVYWLNLDPNFYFTFWRFKQWFPENYKFSPQETLQRLLLALVRDAGYTPAYALQDSNGVQPTDISTSLLSAADGKVKYLVVSRSHPNDIYAPRADRGGPAVTNEYRLCWNRSGDIAYDGGSGKSLPWQKAGNDPQALAFSLKPGEGRVFCFVPYTVTAATVGCPAKANAGSMLSLQLAVQAKGATPGTHVLHLTARDPNGNAATPFDQVITAPAGKATVTVPLAVNDPVGKWTVQVEDLASGATGSAAFVLQPSAASADVPPFKLGWPSEQVGPRVISNGQFLDELSRLAKAYLTPGGNRFSLSFYQQWHGDTRHNMATKLAAVDWRQHAAALRRSLEDGSTLVLTGEDMGRHPLYRFATYPHADGHQLEALQTVIGKATPIKASAHPTVLVFSIGKGWLVLDRDSWDEHLWRMADFTSWQEGWLKDVQPLLASPAGSPAAKPFALSDWFFGK